MREDFRRGRFPLFGECDDCGAKGSLTVKGDLPRGPYDAVLMDRTICDACLKAELAREAAVQAPPIQANKWDRSAIEGDTEKYWR